MNTLFNLTNWRRIKKGAGTVTALLAMADPTDRRSMRQAILRDIPASIVEVDSKQDFHHAATFSEIDLIVADAEMWGAFTFDIIEQIRFGRLHCHAFPVVVMLSERRGGEVHQQLVDCGADLVIPANGAADAISDHLANLTDQRKPFVVVPHYVGPDRRSAARANESSAELIDVPNPLAARAGALSEEEYRREISVAAHNIALMRRGLYTIRQAGGMPVRAINDNKSLLA